MHDFHDFCRRSLDDIKRQRAATGRSPGCEKQAGRFPLYRRPDGREVLVWSSNDYLGMGVIPVLIEAA